MPGIGVASTGFHADAPSKDAPHLGQRNASACTGLLQFGQIVVIDAA
jgi:hypothetical protein